MSKYGNLLSFVIGAGVGAAVTWYMIKDKYEGIAQEEIDSIKELYSRKEKALKEAAGSDQELEAIKVQARNKKDISEYADQIKKNGYINYSDLDSDEGAVKDAIPEPEVNLSRPYVIPPEEFGEINEYETISLLYFADQVLSDENYEIIENVDDIVGVGSLDHFGEYEPDSVFVRNDRRKCDYEILLDQRKIEDIKIARMRNGLDEEE